MAKKEKLQPIKLLLTGVLWAIVYFGIVMRLIGALFLFNFMSVQAWRDKYQEFLDFQWQINNPFDGLLLMCMILWIPFFFFMWMVWYRIAARIKIKLPQKKPDTKKLVDIQNTRQAFVPQKLPAAQVSKEYKAPVLPGQQQQNASGTIKSHTNLAQIIKDSAALARNYKVEIFQHILLEGFRVPLAISTDARAVLIEVVNKRGVNWSVEFTESVDKSNWYSEGGNMEAALADLMGTSRSLAKSEPNSEVLSAVLIPSGRILNAKQTIDYLKSKGVYLLAFKDGEPRNELQSLESFLTEMFELKSGENAGKTKPIPPRGGNVAPVPPETIPEISDEITEIEEVDQTVEMDIIDETVSPVDYGSVLDENELDDTFLTEAEEVKESPDAA